MPSYKSFDIACLESEALERLFDQTALYVRGLRIGLVANGRNAWVKKKYPAATVGIHLQCPMILFSGSLDKAQRIEALAHELVHLLFLYRFGLGVIGLKIPLFEEDRAVFDFLMRPGGDWEFFLGQLGNTAHHLILVDYLREEYGIASDLHLRLLQYHLKAMEKEATADRESDFAKGLIAFEYERLKGDLASIVNVSCQSDSFLRAYDMAQKHFRRASSRSISTPSEYEEQILSFLEELDFRRENFIFFSPKENNPVWLNERKNARPSPFSR